jgi:hypothetical protein
MDDTPVEMNIAGPTFLAPAGAMWRNTPAERDRLAYLEPVVLAGTCTTAELAEFRERRAAHETWLLAAFGDALNDETIRVFIGLCSPVGLLIYRLARIDVVYINTQLAILGRYATAGPAAWTVGAAMLAAAREAKAAAVAAVIEECGFGERFLASVYGPVLRLSPTAR